MPAKTIHIEFPGKGVRKTYPGKKSLILIIVITLLAAAVIYYRFLPAVNMKNTGFWTYLFIVSGIFAVLCTLRGGLLQSGPVDRVKKVNRIPAILTAAFFILPIVLGFVTGARLFYARKYSAIITVNEGTAADLPDGEKTNSIALMDTASAEKLGNREIGSLSHVVSQYDVSSYTQIDYQGTPVKTSPLRYAGFFKWYRNRANGVPGYVLVDPVSMSASYKALPEGMTYVPSAYFSKYLVRHLRFSYPTKMFENVHFEIDEEGEPWYVASTYDFEVGLFNGKQITGVILCDPVTGETVWHPVGEIPRWVDVVYSGDLICEQYNYYGLLSGGYWNSIFGQAGCRKVTEYTGTDAEHFSDYGYVSKDGDIWIYTGVTSVNSDSSNIGFILSNERTEETLFITCAGADEFSAMAAAEGEVQEKRYQSSFPSLIVLDGTPTYIMVLKDSGGLVKMYAAVNVEQYNLVATGSSQKECLRKYEALLTGNITQEEATAETAVPEAEEEAVDLSAYAEKEIKVRKMETIVRDGDTWIYVVDEDSTIYAARYEDVLPMLLVEEGDTITILTDGERFLLP